jgi:hypothetical protein
MKKVNFKIDVLPKVEYDRIILANTIRDSLAQYLVKNIRKKVEAGEIKNTAEGSEYISSIFKKALGPNLSKIELEKMEIMRTRFSFLHYGQYTQTTIDCLIHDVAYAFIALCSGEKKKVKQYIYPQEVFDSKGKILNFRTDEDWEYSRSLRNDVAEVSRKCVREFLLEWQETGKIMTSSELAASHQTAALLDTDESDHYSDDFESEDDTSNEERSSDDKSVINQKSASAASVNDDLEFESENNQNTNIAEIATADNSQPNTLIDNLLTWIYELPEWLHSQFLNSAPIKALIESLEQANAIRDAQSITQDFATKALSIETNFDSNDIPEHSLYDNARISDAVSKDAIDMTMILKEPSVSGYILPQIDIELGAFASNHDFNGLPGFHGYGIDLF